MAAKVAVVEKGEDSSAAISHALQLIGSILELDEPKREVVVKVGVFKPEQGQHTTIGVTQAIIDSFPQAPHVYLVESDNYRGTAAERLKIWQSLFSERVVPFSLTDDPDTRSVEIAGEEYPLSHILFKPNVLEHSRLSAVQTGDYYQEHVGVAADAEESTLPQEHAPNPL